MILPQRPEGVRRYVEETGLPFNILIDEHREVTKRYGVWDRLSLQSWNMARPALFVIDPQGILRSIFVGGRSEFPTHEEILGELEKLRISWQ